MNRDSISNFYKLSIAVLGGVCLTFALFKLKTDVFSWKFELLFLFTILIAPRMSIILPRSKFILSFSDSMIFLAFLLFGGEAAIFIGAIEAYTNCLYMQYKGVKFSQLAIPFNIGATSISTAITYIVGSYLPQFTNIDLFALNTSNLITNLGILALTQFLAVSSFGKESVFLAQ
jgi:hypothetical protein